MRGLKRVLHPCTPDSRAFAVPRIRAAPCSTRHATAPAPCPHPQVRGVAVCDLGLLTSSRDKTVKLWAQDGKTSFSVLQTMVRGARAPSMARRHGATTTAATHAP